MAHCVKGKKNWKVKTTKARKLSRSDSISGHRSNVKFAFYLYWKKLNIIQTLIVENKLEGDSEDHGRFDDT